MLRWTTCHTVRQKLPLTRAASCHGAAPAAANGKVDKGQGPHLGVLLGDDAEKVKRLGLPVGLVPYWQADDPSDAWYEADTQSRAIYTK